jgi:hypothetical protein
MTTGFFSWRWAPAVALVGGAIVIASLAIWLIPQSIGAPSATRATPLPHSRSGVSEGERAGDGEAAERVGAARDVAPAPDFAPTIRTLATPEPVRTGVESFFPSAPEAELPPPLPDDPVPKEPAARALDPVGPGVEPPNTPPQ